MLCLVSETPLRIKAFWVGRCCARHTGDSPDAAWGDRSDTL
jgi:hypothetical protein